MKEHTIRTTVKEEGELIEDSTVEFKTYAYDELSEEAKEKAFETWLEKESNNPYVMEFQSQEMFDSLEALIEQAGYAIKDYSLGPSWNRGNNITLDCRDCDDLQGPRALAWFENTIAGPNRIPWGPYHIPNSLGDCVVTKRAKNARYGYRPGTIEPYPFTGICYDDMFIDCLFKALKEGDTVREALQNLASDYSKAWEAEYEYLISRECFEECQAFEQEYEEDGTIA